MSEEIIYIQYNITLNPQAPEGEMVMATLSTMGFDAFEERETSLVACGPESDVNQKETAEFLHSRQFEFTVERLPRQNWNAIWESSFEPIRVDDFVAVRAAFHAPVSGVAHDLVITPKMSFGTGHHATTWLMLKAMENMDFADQRVMDFGTGTGVLSILAEKKGALDILAVDLDEWSIENAGENLAANYCRRIRLQFSDHLPAGETADILLANINKHVIMSHRNDMLKATVPGGYWIISGFLEADQEDISHELSGLGLTKKHVMLKDGWLAMIWHYPGV